MFETILSFLDTPTYWTQTRLGLILKHFQAYENVNDVLKTLNNTKSDMYWRASHSFSLRLFSGVVNEIRSTGPKKQSDVN